MPRPMTVSDSVVIDVDPATVYEQISDPTQTGRWSPENLGASLDDPSNRASYVGMTFVGRNRRGRMRWATRCRVTAAEAPSRFAFDVEAIGRHTPRIKSSIATWQYDLEPVEGGTRVTETWTDGRRGWPDAVAKAFDKVATGSTFAEFQTRNIRRTLAKLKETLEAAR
jgi:uncharacterized protein YndB with AHSA1/START domain